jgi:hypothetical protein
VTTAVRIRVITSETPARETPTMAVAVLMSEGYAGLLPPIQFCELVAHAVAWTLADLAAADPNLRS